MLKALSGAVAAAFISSAAQAYEVTEVCAVYANSGSAYSVEANIMSGTELNERTGSYSYRSYAKYVVIFWSDGASVIELDYSFCTMDYSFCDGEDQRGYPWKVKRLSYSCMDQMPLR